MRAFEQGDCCSARFGAILAGDLEGDFRVCSFWPSWLDDFCSEYLHDLTREWVVVDKTKLKCGEDGDSVCLSGRAVGLAC